LTFILACLAAVYFLKATKLKKSYYFLGATFSVTMFIISYGHLMKASDRIFFMTHRESMTEVVSHIKKSRQENREFAIPQLKYALVDTLEDGTIVFTLDGILDNCVGIAYSDDNVNPGHTNCGRIIEWRRLDDHWYIWYST
jgi:hypothetical protein